MVRREVPDGATRSPGWSGVVRLVEEAKQAGARILTGGTAPGGPGYFYPITP